MQTISPFLPKPHIRTASQSIQLLPPESHSTTPLTLPQIHTLWLHALSLYNPLTFTFRPTITAHKYLLKHLLLSPTSPSSNSLTVPVANARSRLDENPQSLTTADLKSPEHAPHAYFLFLNLGFILAFTGEYFLASRHFRTALAIDDGSRPGNTAVGHFLLGCAFFELGQYQKAQKDFCQCLLLFSREGGLEGKRELVEAAPWTSPRIAMEGKKEPKHEKAMGEKEGKGDENMRMGFKYKMYAPTASRDEEGRHWKEWELQKDAVEENMQTSVKAARATHKRPDDIEVGTNSRIHGIPGGSLFWPLGDDKTRDRKSSKGGKTMASGEEDKQDDGVGLGLQMPVQSSLESRSKGSDQTQKHEGYAPRQSSTSRSGTTTTSTYNSTTSQTHYGHRKSSDASGSREVEALKALKKERKKPFTSPGDFLKGVPRKSSTPSVKPDDRCSTSRPLQPLHDLPMSISEANHYASLQFNRNSSPHPIIDTTLPAHAHLNLVLGDDPTPRASLAPLVINKRPSRELTVEEKHHKAWLALNGLAEDDDHEDDNVPTPRQAKFSFSTRRTIVTPISIPTMPLTIIGGKENERPTRHTTAHYHDSPHPDNQQPHALPWGPGAAHTSSARSTLPTNKQPITTLSPQADDDSDSEDDFPLAHIPPKAALPSPHAPNSAGSIRSESEHSPASAILSLYGSYTPPDTAGTYSTDGTIFTPSPPPYTSPPSHPINPTPSKKAAALAFTPPLSRPASTTTGSAKRTATLSTVSSSTSSRFTSSPLNKAHLKKSIPLSKSIPRGLGIGIAGLAGPEPAVPLEEAMRVRAKREEEAREEERERKEIEKEYLDWMKRLEDEEKAKEEGKGVVEEVGEMLPRTTFEGFGNKRGKGVSGETLGVRIGVGNGNAKGELLGKEAGEEGRDRSEEEWVAMMKRFHEGTLEEK